MPNPSQKKEDKGLRQQIRFFLLSVTQKLKTSHNILCIRFNMYVKIYIKNENATRQSVPYSSLFWHAIPEHLEFRNFPC